MKRIGKGPVRNISLKLQEEERERRLDFVPEVSALEQETIGIDRETRDLLESMGYGNMNGVVVLNNNEFGDNHTYVDHKNANCESNELYKGIYLDKSKGVFNGKIMVRPDAQKINAFQANNNLLLSEDSSINSKPQLEIYADDVKCSHGCTIGQLDDDALFYMRTRGISKEDAKTILTFAFASEAVEKLSIDELSDITKQEMKKKLNLSLN